MKKKIPPILMVTSKHFILTDVEFFRSFTTHFFFITKMCLFVLHYCELFTMNIVAIPKIKNV